MNFKLLFILLSVIPILTIGQTKSSLKDGRKGASFQLLDEAALRSLYGEYCK